MGPRPPRQQPVERRRPPARGTRRHARPAAGPRRRRGSGATSSIAIQRSSPATRARTARRADASSASHGSDAVRAAAGGRARRPRPLGQVAEPAQQVVDLVRGRAPAAPRPAPGGSARGRPGRPGRAARAAPPGRAARAGGRGRGSAPGPAARRAARRRRTCRRRRSRTGASSRTARRATVSTAVDGDLPSRDAAQDLAQGRQVEDVGEALAVRLDEDREAAVAGGHREQVRRPLALLPERRPGPGPAARQEQRPRRVLAEAAGEQARLRRPRRRRGPRSRRGRGTAAPRRRRACPRPRAAGSRSRRRTRSSGPRARAARRAAPRGRCDHGAWTRPPNGVRMHEPPVAQLVAEPLDDDPAVGRQGARSPRARPRGRRGGSRRRAASRSCVAPQARRRAAPGPSRPGQVGLDLRARTRRSPAPARSAGPTASPCQNGSLPGTPGAGVTITRSWRDLLDPPAEAPEHDHSPSPGAQLVDHLLVELADPPAGRARPRRLEEHAVQAAVRDRAAAGDRDDPGVPPRRPRRPVEPVPGDPRLQLGELVATGRRRRASPSTPSSASRVERLERRRAADDARAARRRSSGSMTVIATSCWASTSSGLRGMTSSARWRPSCIRCDDDGGLEQVAAVLGEDDAPAAARRPGGRPGRCAGGRGRRDVGLSTWMTRSTAPMSMPSSRLSSSRRAPAGGRP